MFRVHPSTIRLWITRGWLAGVRVGERQWRVRRSEVERSFRAGDVELIHEWQRADPYVPPTFRPGARVFDPTEARS